MKVLSIVAPNATRIASGPTTLEIRSWVPRVSPDEDILIVENNRFLTSEGETNPEGRAVAIVLVGRIRPFLSDDIRAACASMFVANYYARELTPVRALKSSPTVLVARGKYEVPWSNC